MRVVTSVGAGLAVAIPAIGALWWFFEHTAQAEDQAKEQAVIVQAVEKLTEIHVRQTTVDEAEEALIAKLCREGKLPAAECK